MLKIVIKSQGERAKEEKNNNLKNYRDNPKTINKIAISTYLTIIKYLFMYLCIYLFLFFGHTACGILVPWPGIEPVPPVVEVQSLNYWAAREVPKNT